MAEIGSVEELRRRAAALEFEPVPPDAPIAQRALDAYAAELTRRLDGGFDPGNGRVDLRLGGPGGVFVVAVSDDAPVACGGVRTIGDRVGEIKRMWVSQDWRGAGLGSRLLRHLETQSAALGHRVVRLDTNATLTEAIALYHRAGYHEIPAYADNPYAQHWFEKQLS